MIDSKGKLFGKINVLDFIVILGLIVLVGGLGYKFTTSKSVVLGKADPLIVEFWTEEAPSFAVDKIKIGDTVGDTERSSNFGKVAAIKIGEAKSVGQNSQGHYLMSSRPGMNSVYMEVYGEGIFNKDGGVSVNNIDYYIGKSIILRVGNATFMGRIYNLSKRG